MDTEAPTRPADLPEDAEWSFDLGLWERVSWVDGRKHGAFTHYYLNGDLACEGAYADGTFDGDLISYRRGEAPAMPLRRCCIPDTARVLRARYARGQVLRQIFFDDQDRPVGDDGVPWPARPSNVPEGAEFVPSVERWVEYGPTAEGHLRERRWTTDGSLEEEVLYLPERATARTLYASDGQPRERTRLNGERQLHGERWLRYASEDENPYVLPGIREEVATFSNGRLHGARRLIDASGNVLREFAYGPDTSESADDAASKAACSHEPRALHEFLSNQSVALKPEQGGARAQRLSGAGVTFALALDELLSGVEPAACFRAMAASLQGDRGRALGLVNAALLLAPERAENYLTRALIRIESGDPDGALADAERLTSSKASEFLRTSVRFHYPSYSFDASAILNGAQQPDGEFEPTQPLERVRHLLGVYATRLLRLRSAVLALVPNAAAAAWLPPNLTQLLPTGPVELELRAARIEDPSDEGIELVDVQLDEQTQLAADDVPSLLRQARADYAALGCLSWLSGNERLTLPAALNWRAEFGLMLSSVVTRFQRVHDRITTGGLVALARGVPGFEWEGSAIDALAPNFLPIVAAEYTELRALVLWLLFPQNLSPFQSDLRGA